VEARLRVRYRAYSGQLAKASDLTHICFRGQTGEKQTAASYQAEAARREALFGNLAEAKQGAEAALKLSSGRDVAAVATLALALSGDEARAEKLAGDLAKRFPQDTIAQLNSLPTNRVAIALGRGNPAKAIETLQVASPCELGSLTGTIFLSLYPVYVRGEAYLASHQGSAAAGEFQKFSALQASF
jgi:hypothetical protein